MRGYEDDVDEYDEYDDYEEDREGQEEEALEEDEVEYQEAEERKPTKEELDYLELRQRLKDSIRKKMKKESSSAHSNLQEKKRKFPNDNYGSFFGPSQPVIAQRVIQESKSLLENQQLASRLLNSNQGSKKVVANSRGSKPGSHDQPRRVITEVQRKVEKLKDTRDYSFLFSDDVELPGRKEPPPRNSSVPDSEARTAHVPMKSKQPLGITGRNAHGGHDARKPGSVNSQVHSKSGSVDGHVNSKSGSVDGHVNSKSGSVDGHLHSKSGSVNSHMHSRLGSVNGHMHSRLGSVNGQMHSKLGSVNGQMHSMLGSLNGQMLSRSGPVNGQMLSRSGSSNGQMHSKSGIYKSASSSKSNSAPADARKQLGSNNGIGPGRPVGPKALPPKPPLATLEKKASATSVKNLPSSVQKSPSFKVQASDPRQHLEQKRGSHEPNKVKMTPKQSMALAKPQMNKALKQVSSHDTYEDHRPKKKPAKPSEDEMALSMIRRMFNTQRFARLDMDEDDSDMEANFDDIMEEEERSARIAKKEDEEQLRLIEEEERQERMRKLAKKRKLSHR